jgi:hypothetical protein
LIHPKFILETKLGDPTRINLEDVKLYWNHWVLKEAAGDPFCFLTGGEGEEEEEEEEEEEAHPTTKKAPTKPSTRPPTSPTPGFEIDSNIPIPSQCDTPAARTICLKRLAPRGTDAGKSFLTIVKQVDAFKVSFVLII